MTISIQGQEVQDHVSHQLSPFGKGFHIRPWVLKILNVPIWIGIFHEEVNPHNMGVEESGSGEHLSIDVDMEGGADVKMERVVLLQQETWSWWTPMRVSTMPLWL